MKDEDNDMVVINYYDVYDYNLHFICEVGVKSQEIGEISKRVEQEIAIKLGHHIEFYRFRRYETVMPVTTNKLPVISFNIFEFANKHGCTVSLRFEDDAILKMDLERRGFRHSCRIDVNRLGSIQTSNIDWVVEDALEESIKEIEKLERKYRYGHANLS